MPPFSTKISTREINKYYFAVILIVLVSVGGFALQKINKPLYSPKPYDRANPVEMMVGPPGDPLITPFSCAVDKNGEVYILDRGAKQVIVVNEKGRYLRKFSGEGSGAAELENPADIVVGQEGQVFISDFNKQAILVFRSDGGYIFSIEDKEKGTFIPSGLAVTKEGELIVYNHAEKGFRFYQSDGTLLKKVGENSTKASPKENHRSLTVMDRDKRIIITDPAKHQVAIYSFDGDLVESWDSEPLMSPRGVAYNEKTGHIYITDNIRHKVFVYDRLFTYIGEFGCYGTAMREFKNPMGIRIDDGRLYITDQSNRRVTVYRLK